MSDELNENEEPLVTDTEPQGSETDTDWKAEARKWEKRAKEANAFREDADKWREYEQSLKPIQERLAEDNAALKAEAESARITLARYEVAAEKQIAPEAIRLLTGSTREELEESADALLALIANQSKPKAPKPDPSQGRPVDGSATPEQQFLAAIENII